MPLYLPELGAYVSDPNLNVYVANGVNAYYVPDAQPRRDCEFPQCPRRGKGYTGCNMRECEKCGSFRYCSRDCQRSHWKTHKKHCRAPKAQDPIDWIEDNKSLLQWMAIEALQLHTDSSAFDSGKMPRALTVVIHHGKQRGAPNTSGIELFSASARPSTPYDLRFCSHSKRCNEKIQAAGGMGALTVTCSLVDVGRRGAKGANVPLVLEYPEPANSNYKYMPTTQWEALFKACINKEKPLSSIEEDLHALPGGCQQEGDAGWGLLQELKGEVSRREVEAVQDGETEET